MEKQAQLERMLQDDGFRQICVRDLQKGMSVAYVETLFGFQSSDRVHVAEVYKVERTDEFTIKVFHSHGATEADDDDSVWARS